MDQQAALIGEHCLEAGDSKCTYGTGAFLLANAGAQPFTSSAGLAVSVAWQVGDQAAYCIDGQVYAAGAAIAWLVRWGFLARPEDLDAVASSVPDSGGVTVVPALTGLGAPWWEPDALGAIEGIGPATATGPRRAGDGGGAGRPGGRCWPGPPQPISADPWLGSGSTAG